MSNVGRQEHLDWCKKRAFEYCDSGDWQGAVSSMASDMGKHQDTQSHPGVALMLQMMISGFINDVNSTRKFIDGFT